MHLSELTTVTLVEYQHDILFGQHLAQFFILVVDVGLHQVRQFLNRRDDNAHAVILQLLLQDTC